MCKELEDEQKAGTKAAQAMVEHLFNMGASSCTIPVLMPHPATGKITAWMVEVRPDFGEAMRDETFDRALEKYGFKDQMLQLVEEMAELQVAICHHLRGRVELSAVEEEVADVEVMLGQLKRKLSRASVSAFFWSKVHRLRQRLDGMVS